MKDSCLILGYGYSAKAIAEVLLAAGWQVLASSRAPEKFNQPNDITILNYQDLSKTDLSHVTHVLSSVPPDESGDSVLNDYSNLFSESLPALTWLGYLSSTGVYGDHQGAWVDEQSAVLASTERGQRRLQAEQQWQAFAAEQKLPLFIFRLAGIYGPGRNMIAKLQAGELKNIIKPGHYFSRIHVADIAQIVQAAMQPGTEPGIYNVCDDEPTERQDVIAYVAELLGVSCPPGQSVQDAKLSAMGQSFYQDNRRVSNQKLKQKLKVQLKYPNYQIAYQDLVAD